MYDGFDGCEEEKGRRENVVYREKSRVTIGQFFREQELMQKVFIPVTMEQSCQIKVQAKNKFKLRQKSKWEEYILS